MKKLFVNLLYLIISSSLFIFFVFSLFMPAGPASGQSTIAFNSGMNCYGVWALPDTGQTASYTATFGEDHDYSSAAQPSYTVLNPVGISSVTVDNVTGLMWITNPATDAGMGGTYTWANAILACENLDYAGYTDWRLPNVRELSSILTYASYNPAADTTAFPATKTSNYWSSTTYTVNTSTAWYVGFYEGTINVTNAKTVAQYVRCVRQGL